MMPGCSGERQSLWMGTGVPCRPADGKLRSPGAIPPGHNEEASKVVSSLSSGIGSGHWEEKQTAGQGAHDET